ncbi:MAG: hypothetical protein CMI36_09875 [Owenweeksia sp.]|nr:hypothetical protein [Owenweeksia sp.]MBF99290.1 hypothetical protein [Owenweeksia sp.]HBF18639.1 hypothetical protein [Cryomorphaceae bacterium]|tara:strand:+ start:200 stop:751 length:552 start_codon:yes stop_codon:yes gene_type:complete
MSKRKSTSTTTKTEPTEAAHTGESFLGTILAFAATETSVPKGWLVCNGSKIPDGYPELISMLQSEYTPDLRGRTLIGAGTPKDTVQDDGDRPNFVPGKPFLLRANGGEALHQLKVGELPEHSHELSSRKGSGSENLYAHTWSKEYNETHPKNDIYSTSRTGEDKPHNTLQPYYVINYIIKATT